MSYLKFVIAQNRIDNGEEMCKVIKEVGLTSNAYFNYLLKEQIENLTMEVNIINLKLTEIKIIFINIFVVKYNFNNFVIDFSIVQFIIYAGW